MESDKRSGAYRRVNLLSEGLDNEILKFIASEFTHIQDDDLRMESFIRRVDEMLMVHGVDAGLFKYFVDDRKTKVECVEVTSPTTLPQEVAEVSDNGGQVLHYQDGIVIVFWVVAIYYCVINEAISGNQSRPVDKRSLLLMRCAVRFK